MHPFGLIVLALIGLIGLLWLRAQPSGQKTLALAKLILVMAILGLVYLSISGRIHLLGALVALGLPFIQKLLPLLLRLLPFSGIFRPRQPAGPTGSSGNRSRVTTALLEMTLDHDTGVMDGTVLQGDLQGRSLSDLSESEFIRLLKTCRAQDGDSARLLETYLDKRFGDSWRADDTDTQGPQSPEGSGELSREEAYAILGIEPGASRDEIIQAHRRLMQKMHPDRGGSTWLAARINEAKKCLLD
ncbi:DnaJ domain protein [Nitrincola lacisaponensis]|uniref:DnaJ domain protein n=1 Tax=Nitrincola lacisaponensis TaxID=267850 RepID=A0A063Y412_9GAMM|nr:DnaJ domain-containing protein [Nitrincola lacisaponensis]KDE39277.1 DnaJ domain protein [Nitrincola lacisaponensis]